VNGQRYTDDALVAIFRDVGAQVERLQRQLDNTNDDLQRLRRLHAQDMANLPAYIDNQIRRHLS
jgi:hypothetical protein